MKFSLAIALMVALLAGLAIWISRSITVPLAQSVAMAEQLAVGDMSVNIRVTSKDEIGQLQDSMQKMAISLKDVSGAALNIAEGNLAVNIEPRSDRDELMIALNSMTRKLRDVVTNVQMAVNNVSSGSQAMSSSSEEMSQGASEQAASAEEASSSIEEMNGEIALESVEDQGTRAMVLLPRQPDA